VYVRLIRVVAEEGPEGAVLGRRTLMPLQEKHTGKRALLINTKMILFFVSNTVLYTVLLARAVAPVPSCLVPSPCSFRLSPCHLLWAEGPGPSTCAHGWELRGP